MKARIKATGEIIDVEYEKHHPCSDIISYKDKNGAVYYSKELDFVFSTTDWNQVRVQASIGAMQVILGRTNCYEYEEIAEQAVGYADALVKELVSTLDANINKYKND